MTGRVLDRTAIIDVVRSGGSVYSRALLFTAVDLGVPLSASAAALLDAWSGLPPDDRALMDLFLDAPALSITAVDVSEAARAGIRAHRRGDQARFDAAAAHTVELARRAGFAILTEDPEPLLALDPTVEIELLPGE